MSSSMAITTTTPTTYLRRTSLLRRQFPPQIHTQFQILRCGSDSKPKRGFGPKDPKANKVTSWTEVKGLVSLPRKSTSQQSGTVTSQPPRLSLRADRQSNNIPLDLQFEERLEAVKRSALEKKKAEEIEEFVAIEYDAPVESESGTVGFGTKIGVGVAVVVFGLIFALGDFLPSERVLVEGMDDIDVDSLKSATGYLVETLQDPATVGSCPGEGKVSLIAAFTPGVVDLGIQAGKFIGPIAKLCGGGGGGRPNFAQAGGRKHENLSSALEKARSDLVLVLSEKTG